MTLVPRYTVGALMIAIMLLINVEVAFRFFLNLPLDALSEIVTLLFPWVSLLGAAVAVDVGANMSLHVIGSRVGKRAASRLRAFVAIATLAFAVFLIAQGANYAALTRTQLTNVLALSRSGEVLAFPVSGILIALYSLRSLVTVIQRGPKTRVELTSEQF